MKDYWQITLDELIDDGPRAPVPNREPGGSPYTQVYQCQICGAYVGVYYFGDCKCPAEWLMQRDICKNGHKQDWAEFNQRGRQ